MSPKGNHPWCTLEAPCPGGGAEYSKADTPNESFIIEGGVLNNMDVSSPRLLLCNTSYTFKKTEKSMKNQWFWISSDQVEKVKINVKIIMFDSALFCLNSNYLKKTNINWKLYLSKIKWNVKEI